MAQQRGERQPAAGRPPTPARRRRRRAPRSPGGTRRRPTPARPASPGPAACRGRAARRPAADPQHDQHPADRVREGVVPAEAGRHRDDHQPHRDGLERLHAAILRRAALHGVGERADRGAGAGHQPRVAPGPVHEYEEPRAMKTTVKTPQTARPARGAARPRAARAGRGRAASGARPGRGTRRPPRRSARRRGRRPRRRPAGTPRATSSTGSSRSRTAGSSVNSEPTTGASAREQQRR